MIILLLSVALGYWLGRNLKVTRRRRAKALDWRDTNIHHLEEEL